MSTSRLLENWNDSDWTEVTENNVYTVGNVFTVDTTVLVRELWWYRKQTGSNRVPTKLTLWRAGDSARLLDVSAPDPVGTGWRFIDVSGWGVQLTTGQTYVVAELTYNGFVEARNGTTTPPTPGAHLAFPTNFRAGVAGDQYPSSHSQSPLQALDVVVDDALPPPEPSGNISLQVDQRLASWFDSDASINTREGELPWLTKGVVDSILSDTGDLLTDLGNVASTLAGVATKNNSIWDLAGAFVEAEYSAIRAAWLALGTRITGSDSGGGSAFYGPSGTQVAEGVETLIARESPDRLLTRPPATGWTKTNEQAFNGSFLWIESADYFLIDVTSSPTWRAFEEVAGAGMYYFDKWWAPCSAGYLGPRQFIDALNFECHQLPRRLPGILARFPAGWEGTVQAWTYTG
jgi:hypothetical protein